MGNLKLDDNQSDFDENSNSENDLNVNIHEIKDKIGIKNDLGDNQLKIIQAKNNLN